MPLMRLDGSPSATVSWRRRGVSGRPACAAAAIAAMSNAIVPFVLIHFPVVAIQRDNHRTASVLPAAVMRLPPDSPAARLGQAADYCKSSPATPGFSGSGLES